MSAKSATHKRSQQITTVISASYFCLFSFIYLSLFQGGLLAARINSWSSGHIVYNSWLGGGIITILLYLLRILFSRFRLFKSKNYVFSYAASFIILGAITFDTQYYNIPLAVCIFSAVTLITLILFTRWSRTQNNSYGSMLNRDMMKLMLLSCLTVTIGNTNEDLHHELAMNSAFEKGDYEKVLLIGEKSQSVSRKMADLRIRALGETGKLGDRLFNYPQPYIHLPVLDEKPIEKSKQLIMSSLFLNKQINSLYKEIKEAGYQAEAMPRHYAEAMLLYKYLHPEAEISANKDSEERFESYLKLKEEIIKEQGNTLGTIVEKNKMKREFGDTFWWYFMYN